MGVRRDHVFALHEHSITLPTLDTPMILQPFGDIHYHNPACDRDRFKAFCKQEKKTSTPQTLYLSLGDLDELCSDSEREKLGSEDLHEGTRGMLDGLAEQQTKDLARELSFADGKMLGLIEGNHEWIFKDGKTSTHMMADLLHSKPLGSLAYIRVCISIEGTTKTAKLDIVACHGRAGGKCAGTTINQVDDLRTVFPEADIYIMGHDHRRGALPVSTLTVHNNRGKMQVKQHEQYLCRSGSFLRGYVPEMSSYAVDRLLRPAVLGTIRGEIRLHRDTSMGRDVLVKDISFRS